MAKKNKSKKPNRKKELRNGIVAKLESVLSDFKTGISEKTFNDALKRGSKLLSKLLFVKKKKEKVKKKKNKAAEVTTDVSQ